MTEFFKTGMGHTFFERTMPELVRELGRLGGAIGTLEHAVTRLADRGVEPPRRRVLLAHRDRDILRSVRLALADRCEMHLARSYSVAEEILALHEIDILVTELEPWHPAGAPLFDLARADGGATQCVLLVPGDEPEREALALRRGADAAIDDENVDRMIRGIERLLR